MQLNNYYVEIAEGKEIQSPEGTYIEISHGNQYTITLANDHPSQCNADVWVDGKHQGIYRLRIY